MHEMHRHHILCECFFGNIVFFFWTWYWNISPACGNYRVSGLLIGPCTRICRVPVGDVDSTERFCRPYSLTTGPIDLVSVGWQCSLILGDCTGIKVRRTIHNYTSCYIQPMHPNTWPCRPGLGTRATQATRRAERPFDCIVDRKHAPFNTLLPYEGDGKRDPPLENVV